MFCCVRSDSMKVSSSIQKDVDIDGLLRNDIKYFASVEEASSVGYVPLGFCVCVRSVYDNTVLQIVESDGVKVCHNTMFEVPENPHKGADLVMYMTSVVFLNSFVSLADGFNNIMMRHSMFQCVGLLNDGIVKPRIVSHIIMSDEGMKLLHKYLKTNVVETPIGNINILNSYVPIVDTLITVMGGNKK